MISLRRLWLLNGRSPWKYYFCYSKRPLYSSSSLGIDSFILHRQQKLKFIPNIHKFRTQLKSICENDDKGLVLLEDLNKMTALADSDEDLELLLRLLRKFSKQKGVIVFKSYYFAPEVMRLLHLKNRHQDAVKLVEDEDLFPHFHQVVTATLLLDLLFKNNEYEEVIRIFNLYQNKALFEFPPTSFALLYIAACYKLNTTECFEKALQVHKLCTEGNIKVPLRNSLFLSALAIKQNQPVCAIEVFDKPTFHVLIENLKCMAYAQANRFDDVYCAIRSVLSSSKVEKYFLTSEAVSFIENEIKKEDYNEPHYSEFQKLKEELLLKNIIVNEVKNLQPLDNYLCETVHYNSAPRKPSKARLPRH